MLEKRLQIELESLQQYYGIRPSLGRNAAGELYFDHNYRLEIDDEVFEFPIRVTLPVGYPNCSPKVQCSVIGSSPHRYSDGTICWHPHGPGPASKSGWNPATDTLVRCLNALYLWFLKYLHYKATGIWPEAGK